MGKDEHNEEDTVLQNTFNLAASVFPGLIKELGIDSFQTPGSVKSFLTKEIRKQLINVDDEKHMIMMQQEKAVELCIELGMNEQVVHMKFEFMKIFEPETGIVSKTPILLSIAHLISTLDVEDQFGEAKPEIIKDFLGIEYVGENTKKGLIRSTIDLVNGILEKVGHSYRFMHGVTGATLEQLSRKFARLRLSEFKPDDGTRHDFGRRLCCFLANLLVAALFGVDCSWPKPMRNRSPGLLESDNVAVILFLKDPKDIEESIKCYVGPQKPFDDLETMESVFVPDACEMFQESQNSTLTGTSGFSHT